MGARVAPGHTGQSVGAEPPKLKGEPHEVEAGIKPGPVHLILPKAAQTSL
jgi:hypothetical protein